MKSLDQYKITANYFAFAEMRSWESVEGRRYIDLQGGDHATTRARLAELREELARIGAKFRVDEPSRFKAKYNGATYEAQMVVVVLY